jgi:hypothetical protein
MITKYGPVPQAILEPPAEEAEAREKSSLITRIFGGNRSHRIQARSRACFANQRVCLGAIEMYNMDHSTMYNELYHPDVSDASGMFITEKYLKSPLHQVEPGCYYRSYGDLTDDGIIYCDYHGCVIEDRDGLRAAAGYTPKVKTSKGDSDNAMIFVIVFLGVMAVGVMVVLHNVLPKAPNS